MSLVFDVAQLPMCFDYLSSRFSAVDIFNIDYAMNSTKLHIPNA